MKKRIFLTILICLSLFIKAGNVNAQDDPNDIPPDDTPIFTDPTPPEEPNYPVPPDYNPPDQSNLHPDQCLTINAKLLVQQGSWGNNGQAVISCAGRYGAQGYCPGDQALAGPDEWVRLQGCNCLAGGDCITVTNLPQQCERANTPMCGSNGEEVFDIVSVVCHNTPTTPHCPDGGEYRPIGFCVGNQCTDGFGCPIPGNSCTDDTECGGPTEPPGPLACGQNPGEQGFTEPHAACVDGTCQVQNFCARDSGGCNRNNIGTPCGPINPSECPDGQQAPHVACDANNQCSSSLTCGVNDCSACGGNPPNVPNACPDGQQAPHVACDANNQCSSSLTCGVNDCSACGGNPPGVHGENPPPPIIPGGNPPPPVVPPNSCTTGHTPRNACNASGQCVSVQECGLDTCTAGNCGTQPPPPPGNCVLPNKPQHMACNASGQCISVNACGPDSCTAGSCSPTPPPPPGSCAAPNHPFRNACVNGQCKSIQDCGVDSCTNDASCATLPPPPPGSCVAPKTPSFKACSNGQCLSVQECGLTSCATAADCVIPAGPPPPALPEGTCTCDGIQVGLNGNEAIFPGGKATIVAFGKVEGANVGLAKITGMKFTFAPTANGGDAGAMQADKGVEVVVNSPNLVRYRSTWDITVPNLTPGIPYRVHAQITCERKAVASLDSSSTVGVLGTATEKSANFLDDLINFFKNLFGLGSSTPPAGTVPVATNPPDVLTPGAGQQLQLKPIKPATIFDKKCTDFQVRFDNPT